MNFYLHRIALDIHKTVEQLTISCKKNDTARRLLVTLTENGFPYSITQDCYAVFTAKKTDGTPIYDNCTIQNNTIIYDMSPKTVSSEGLLECEVTLYGNDGAQITSPRFLLRVYASVVDDDEMESSAEFGALGELVKATNDLINDVNFKLASGAFVGATGSSGVYVGTEEPTDPDITVWINPEEETIPMSASITETDEGILLSVTDSEGTEEGFIKHGKDGVGGSGGGLTTAQFNALDAMFKLCAFIKEDISAEYNAFVNAFMNSGEPDIPIEPDSGISQNGSILIIASGVTATQENNTLSIVWEG
jgi:hypothetical protein